MFALCAQVWFMMLFFHSKTHSYSLPILLDLWLVNINTLRRGPGRFRFTINTVNAEEKCSQRFLSNVWKWRWNKKASEKKNGRNESATAPSALVFLIYPSNHVNGFSLSADFDRKLYCRPRDSNCRNISLFSHHNNAWSHTFRCKADAGREERAENCLQRRRQLDPVIQWTGRAINVSIVFRVSQQMIVRFEHLIRIGHRWVFFCRVRFETVVFFSPDSSTKIGAKQNGLLKNRWVYVSFFIDCHLSNEWIVAFKPMIQDFIFPLRLFPQFSKHWNGMSGSRDWCRPLLEEWRSWRHFNDKRKSCVEYGSKYAWKAAFDRLNIAN